MRRYNFNEENFDKFLNQMQEHHAPGCMNLMSDMESGMLIMQLYSWSETDAKTCLQFGAGYMLHPCLDTRARIEAHIYYHA